MSLYNRLPKLVRFILSLMIFEMFIFTLLRVAFYLAFDKYDDNHTSGDILYSFWLGFRFDIQLFAIAFLPLFLLGGVKYIGLYKSKIGKYLWLSYIFLANLIILLVYGVDFPYYDFFKKMVDSSIIRYMYDIGEAMRMLSEGYPLVSSSLALLTFLALLFFIVKIIYEKVEKIDDVVFTKKQKVTLYSLFFILYIFSGYGKFELYPWRWSEAFYSSNNYLSYLASNPVIYFKNTLKNKDIKYDINAVEKSYDRVADFLDVDVKDINKHTLVREVTPNHNEATKFKTPNIVFILGESTSYARSSLSSNPLNATPFLKKMSDSGITYTRFYTPHSGTARSVWASTTGLTDVERMKTSSRNPMTVSQNMIINSLDGYEKFYFIGGSLSWGNVRGVISNIDGLHKFEELDYKNSSRNDVWGISDVHLASEVNDVLKTQTKPFFAFVQLSGNHSPNTIPDDNYGFKRETKISEEDYLKYAFDGGANDYNGQKFLDHSVKRLITLAKKESYFENTIFIFIGDHGLPKKALHMHDAEQLFQTHTLHTPLIFYAPKLLKHRVIEYPVSEVDIMATVAGLSGKKYINSSMGRDILDKNFDAKEHYAFFMTHENNPKINLIAKDYILRMRADGSDAKLLEYYYKDKPVDLSESKPEIFKNMRDTCRGIYELTRYTRYHNSADDVSKYLKQRSTK